MSAAPVAALHWFRKGLRIHDNPALLRAAEGADVVFPVFIIDPYFVKSGRVGILRYNFLLEALRDLDNTLRTRFHSRLFVARGNPTDVLPKLVDRWKISKITFETDTEPYALKRDEAVRAHFSKSKGVEVLSFSGHTLWNPDDLIALNRGAPPVSYQSFLTLAARMPEPAHHEDPRSLPAALQSFSEAEFGVPTLAEMGYPPMPADTRSLFPGGETEALRRLAMFIEQRVTWIRAFEKPHTSPNSLAPSTTVLSPYLKFGCLSARFFHRELRRVCAGQPHTKPPVSLEGQLLWREFFYTVARGTPNFDRMQGNRICRQIPWDKNAELLKAWREARTGFPFIDAIMTQLRTEGWIHHLARHAVACFLTRGDLWQSWEDGAAVFDELLLDADWALNSANWMWLSCSSFFYQYFRCYSPIAFGKKTDPNGDYIRKYLPQLRRYPAKYIYQPWEAPQSVQLASGCVIGTDYPAPIVDHAVVSKGNMQRMQQAYAAAGHGAARGGADGDDQPEDVPDSGAAGARKAVKRAAGAASSPASAKKGRGKSAAAPSIEAFLVKKGDRPGPA